MAEDTLDVSPLRTDLAEEALELLPGDEAREPAREDLAEDDLELALVDLAEEDPELSHPAPLTPDLPETDLDLEFLEPADLAGDPSVFLPVDFDDDGRESLSLLDDLAEDALDPTLVATALLSGDRFRELDSFFADSLDLAEEALLLLVSPGESDTASLDAVEMLSSSSDFAEVTRMDPPSAADLAGDWAGVTVLVLAAEEAREELGELLALPDLEAFLSDPSSIEVFSVILSPAASSFPATSSLGFKLLSIEFSVCSLSPFDSSFSTGLLS